jgi:hypothetical protein
MRAFTAGSSSPSGAHDRLAHGMIDAAAASGDEHIGLSQQVAADPAVERIAKEIVSQGATRHRRGAHLAYPQSPARRHDEKTEIVIGHLCPA